MRQDRLKVLRDYLAQVPEEQLDMEHWWCGTAGCAAGHACHIPAFREEGLFMEPLEEDHFCPRYKHAEGYRAIQKFFELTADQRDRIFDPETYSEDEDAEITRAMVLERIDEVLQEEIA